MLNKRKLDLISKKLGYEISSYSFLGAGAHNFNYLLNSRERKFVLRISSINKNPLIEEYRVLKLLENTNLAPKVYICDLSKKIINKNYLIEEYLEGKHPKNDEEFIKNMGKWYKILHNNKTNRIPKFARKNNYYSLIKALGAHGLKDYKKSIQHLEGKIRIRTEEIYNKMITIIKEKDKLLHKRNNFSLIHGDPWSENIFLTKTGIKLVDWEFAEYDLPEWDLMQFIRHYCYNEERKKIFLNSYRYKINSLTKEIFNVIELIESFSTLAWFINRLRLIKENKIQEKHSHHNKKKVENRIIKELKKTRQIIKNSKFF